MSRKINGFVIAAMISVGIHIIIFLSLIVLTPSLRYVQARPGTIMVSLGGSDRNGLQGGRAIPKPAHGQLFQQDAETAGVSVSSHDEIQVGTIGGASNSLGRGQSGQEGDVTVAIPLPGNPEPPYPERARRRGYEGTVNLELEILANGRVGKIKVKKSSGDAEMDANAVNAARASRFNPTRIAGIPVKSTAHRSYTYQLKN